MSNMTSMNPSTPCYQLYQNLVDRLFGSDVIEIKKARKDNNVIGALKYIDSYHEFINNFEARLTRLRDRYKDTKSYKTLLQTVAQIADYNNWEGAYAELVAYDVMSNGGLSSIIELNKTLPASDSFVGEMGGHETNEDGFISEYNLYFDVKSLSDTVTDILKGIIDEAVNRAGQKAICNVFPEYPYDDDEQEYQKNRSLLVEELRYFVTINKPSNNKGKACLSSRVLPGLSFRIIWGGGINSSESSYDAFRHAENCKHLIFKRYTKKFLKHNPFFLVLVNFPLYNRRIISFVDEDEVFYRSLARRTFCEYKNQSTLMSEIVSKYKGTETVFDVSNHLSGIIFIDDQSLTVDTYSCHIYLNPNATNKLSFGRLYLEQLVALGDKRGILDDMEHDNY